MTTPNVTGLDAWGAKMPQGQPGLQDYLGQDKSDSFLSVMNKTAKSQAYGVEAGAVPQTAAKTDVTAELSKKPEKTADTKKTEDTPKQDGRQSRDAKEVVRDDKKTTDSTKTEVKDKVTDEVKQTIKAKTADIKVTIASELDISVEELEAVMETLGLTEMDLLNPQTAPQLVAEVTENDISAVLTDEGLYNEITVINDIQREATSDLMQELNLTKDEFIETVNTVKAENDVTPDAKIVTEPEETFDESLKGAVQKNDFENIRVTVENSVRDEVRTPAEANPEKNDTDVTERKSVPDEVKAEGLSEIERMDVKGRDEHSHSENNRQNHETPNQNMTFMQNLTQTVAEIQVGSTTENFADPYLQARNILDQIDSQIKIGFKADSTSMELQLNPASLGRINVRLVASNGEVTAHFEAQNASVRAALEGHVSELRQSLENQGVKIESVEVTVASHAFEQNLMQGQDGNAQNANPQNRSRMRRINLNEDEEDGIEGVDTSPEAEADRIARSMMAANGGSVDFQA